MTDQPRDPETGQFTKPEASMNDLIRGDVMRRRGFASPAEALLAAGPEAQGDTQPPAQDPDTGTSSGFDGGAGQTPANAPPKPGEDMNSRIRQETGWLVS